MGAAIWIFAADILIADKVYRLIILDQIGFVELAVIHRTVSGAIPVSSPPWITPGIRYPSAAKKGAVPLRHQKLDGQQTVSFIDPAVAKSHNIGKGAKPVIRKRLISN